jgi:hypothetical protein
MRTTLDIRDEVLQKARQRAAETRTSLTRVIEQALHDFLEKKPAKSFRLHGGKVGKGKRPPRVDVADRDALHDFMNDG